ISWGRTPDPAWARQVGARVKRLETCVGAVSTVFGPGSARFGRGASPSGQRLNTGPHPGAGQSPRPHSGLAEAQDVAMAAHRGVPGGRFRGRRVDCKGELSPGCGWVWVTKARSGCVVIRTPAVRGRVAGWVRAVDGDD